MSASSVLSMTGYGSASADSAAGRLWVEFRSVNARFLDIGFRLPEELRPLEPALREWAGTAIQRGKLECRAGVGQSAAIASAIPIDTHRLQHLAQAQMQVRSVLPEATALSVADCLRFPGVVQDASPDAALWVEWFRPVAQAALRELIDNRAREGARLAAVIRDHAHAIAQRIEAIRPRLPELSTEHARRLNDRLREVATGALQGTSIPLEETLARIRQEVAVHGLKTDITEELARLETHLVELHRVLDTGGAVGKRLDFLMQELNREANTIGSKAASLAVTQTSLDLKLLIEQIREQVQNLE